MKSLSLTALFCVAFGMIGCGLAPPPPPVNVAAHSGHMADKSAEMSEKYKTYKPPSVKKPGGGHAGGAHGAK